MADDQDHARRLRELLRRADQAIPTSGLERLLKTGRSAAGLGAAVLGGRLRGEGQGLGAADVEAMMKLATRLGELKGVAMKAGQIISYVDMDLPDELRRVLSVLQTQSQPTPFHEIESTIHRALGPKAGALLEHLERDPISNASIGQVHRGRLPDGTEVAVKVRHPGVDKAMKADFDTAATGSTLATALLPGARLTTADFLHEARDAMLEECDFLLEAERQATFGRLFARDDVLVIPEVERDWSGPSVLTTRWLSGRSFQELLDSNPAQAERDRIGVTLFRFYVGTLYRHGLFHADPHPGNYAFRENGRVVIYDFGCVRKFDRPTVQSFAALVSAVRADDTARIRESLEALGARVPRDRVTIEHVRRLLRGAFAPLVRPGAHRIEAGVSVVLHELARDKRTMIRLALPGRLLFLFRLRFGLYAVLDRLGAVADWSALESQWAAEA